MNDISKAAALMGCKGGKRRAQTLSAKRRQEIARMGYRAGIGRKRKNNGANILNANRLSSAR